MSEIDLAVIKPEMMKPYVWLQTSDDSIQQVEQEIAMFCPLICQEIIQKGMGSSKNCAICLPQQVSPAMLSLILDYCRFHQVPGRSNKERKSYDERFVRIETEKLCELTSAADSLQLKPLVDLTSRALARIIEGKTPEEIREIFHLPDDLTEEEKLEPLRNITADPRIRLLNRLYAKKRKELKEREKLKNVEVEEEHVDERSLDDLLSFINGNDDPKGVKTSKNKKKNRKKKEQQKNSLAEASELNTKEVNGHNIRHQSSEADRISEISYLHHTEDDSFTPKVELNDGDIDDEIGPALKEKIDRHQSSEADRISETSYLHHSEDYAFTSKFDLNDGCIDDEIDPALKEKIDRHRSSEADRISEISYLHHTEDDNIDDGIDPALKEKIDREVEDFARRLNSVRPKRIQKFLPSGQESKTVLFTTDQSGFLRRHA
ncbi:SKP1-like protein 21 isoform X2 [Abrus precatorius]|uniref:SKP1-like protein 21 isoform X2 n=1 Tax=Abrus precatorius TaxID=3816 RepID=A0A8B8JRR8_ABRPR|nr:SKP1-like protein 21 isoform X2 [Abrus precatorius]